MTPEVIAIETSAVADVIETLNDVEVVAPACFFMLADPV